MLYVVLLLHNQSQLYTLYNSLTKVCLVFSFPIIIAYGSLQCVQSMNTYLHKEDQH